jgi:hypothetical protein
MEVRPLGRTLSGIPHWEYVAPDFSPGDESNGSIAGLTPLEMRPVLSEIGGRGGEPTVYRCFLVIHQDGETGTPRGSLQTARPCDRHP